MTEPIIDTHVHVWRLADGWYGWNTPDLGPVHADASLDDLGPELDSADTSELVLVQAADEPAETDQLLRLASDDHRVLGVVGWLDLTSPGFARQLRRPGLVGIRQLWHDHGDPAELVSVPVLRGLETCGEAGLPVEVPDAFPRLADSVLGLAKTLPGTTVVIDHAGKPPFGDRAAWLRWEDWFVEASLQPNVVIKISGLFGGSGSSHPASDEELAVVVRLTYRHAGPLRTMIGSDWPMFRGHGFYAESISRLRALLADWPEADRTAAFSGTARRVYAGS